MLKFTIQIEIFTIYFTRLIISSLYLLKHKKHEEYFKRNHFTNG